MPGFGAYGFAFTGLTDDLAVTDQLVVAPDHWPTLTIEWRRAEGPQPPARHTDDDGVLLFLTGGHVEVSRTPLRATLHLPDNASADELLHPYLAAIAALAGPWHGRLAFHGGAFGMAGSAWGLLAAKEEGKSTTLAYMAEQGLPVLADDVIVLAGGQMMAGPRTIDLRDGALELGLAAESRVRGATRYRKRLAEIAPEIPAGGFVLLEGGAVFNHAGVASADRVRELTAARALGSLPSEAQGLLDAVTLPMIRVRCRRP